VLSWLRLLGFQAQGRHSGRMLPSAPQPEEQGDHRKDNRYHDDVDDLQLVTQSLDSLSSPARTARSSLRIRSFSS